MVLASFASRRAGALRDVLCRVFTMNRETVLRSAKVGACYLQVPTSQKCTQRQTLAFKVVASRDFVDPRFVRSSKVNFPLSVSNDSGKAHYTVHSHRPTLWFQKDGVGSNEMLLITVRSTTASAR
jgi:hypothetical protein